MMIKSMMGSTRMMCLAGMASLSAGLGHAAESFRVEEATIAGIHQAMADRSLTCRQLVQAYLDRIVAYDHNGPALNAILTLNPKALAEADALDVRLCAVRPGRTAPLHPAGAEGQLQHRRHADDRRFGIARGRAAQCGCVRGCQVAQGRGDYFG